MGLFNFFKSKNNEPTAIASESSSIEHGTVPSKEVSEIADDQGEQNTSPEIPEHVFVEYEKPNTKSTMEPEEVKQEVSDLQMLYRFLEQNLERKGYDDALMNPDTSFMEEHIQFIHNELNLVLAKVKTYYSSHLRTVNFHIETRKRNGMIETVDELLSHKATIEEEVKIVQAIETDAQQRVGLCQNLFLSYRKGFKNGFAAITFNTVLGRRSQ
ncbi:MAG: hypothetical protein ACKO96_24605 [Flammeovirgaceae bacterium]